LTDGLSDGAEADGVRQRHWGARGRDVAFDAVFPGGSPALPMRAPRDSGDGEPRLEGRSRPPRDRHLGGGGFLVAFGRPMCKMTPLALLPDVDDAGDAGWLQRGRAPELGWREEGPRVRSAANREGVLQELAAPERSWREPMHGLRPGARPTWAVGFLRARPVG
jgi:hypothetical protein